MVKKPANSGDAGVANLIPGERNGRSLQYPCLENPMDREAWWAVVHRVAESDAESLSMSDITALYLING